MQPTAILAQVSREALQGEGLEAVLQRICDFLVRSLPVAIASIILLDEDATAFVQEVWAGELDLSPPALACFTMKRFTGRADPRSTCR